MNNGVCRRNGDWNQNICCGLVSFGLFDWVAFVQGFETQLCYNRLNSGTYILWIWEELKKCKHIAYCCLQFCKGDDERQPVLLEIFHFPFFMFTIVHHKGVLFIIRRLGGLCLSAKDRKSTRGHFRQTVFTVLVSLLYCLRLFKFSLSNIMHCWTVESCPVSWHSVNPFA